MAGLTGEKELSKLLFLEAVILSDEEGKVGKFKFKFFNMVTARQLPEPETEMASVKLI